MYICSQHKRSKPTNKTCLNEKKSREQQNKKTKQNSYKTHQAVLLVCRKKITETNQTHNQDLFTRGIVHITHIQYKTSLNP